MPCHEENTDPGVSLIWLMSRPWHLVSDGDKFYSLSENESFHLSQGFLLHLAGGMRIKGKACRELWHVVGS